jgi:hypothetical protein
MAPTAELIAVQTIQPMKSPVTHRMTRIARQKARRITGSPSWL